MTSLTTKWTKSDNCFNISYCYTLLIQKQIFKQMLCSQQTVLTFTSLNIQEIFIENMSFDRNQIFILHGTVI